MVLSDGGDARKVDARMATRAKSNPAQKEILKQIAKQEAHTAKFAAMKNQNAMVKAVQAAGKEHLKKLRQKYRTAA